MEKRMEIGWTSFSMLMKSLLVLFFIVCSSGVKATEITTSVGGVDVTLNYTLITNGDNNTAEVTRSTDLVTTVGTSLAIPVTVSYGGTNCSVTSIGDSAFYFCHTLTSVTIPGGVTNIGNGTFYFCKGLTSVTMPESMTNISAYAFSFCSKFASVTIPEKVISIGKCAFMYCSVPNTITIPKNLTSIGEDGGPFESTVNG